VLAVPTIVLEPPADPTALDEQLNDLAQQGWRIVCAVGDRLILGLTPTRTLTWQRSK